MRLQVPGLALGAVSVAVLGFALHAKRAEKPTLAVASLRIDLPPPEPPPKLPACPADMVEVDGDYCTQLEQKCIRQEPRKRGCDEYERSSVCKGETVHLRYCIDKYEFPNREGEKPLYDQNWYDADAKCKSVGKRVCQDPEWTLACEGPERLPYPYGYVRDSEACTIDKPSRRINEDRFYSVHREEELARLDQRDPSGTRPRCVSGYGVHDMTGNVDEWTTNPSGKPFRGALKGGNWGAWRNACRPSTLGHAAWFRYYQTGFRCCADPKSD